MTVPARIPDFATAPWYRDYSDHRCPHDAWLESITISEPATGARNEIRCTSIEVRLLGAYHDGFAIFRYSGVTRYELSAGRSKHGLGDWLSDDFSVLPEGHLLHQIRWAESDAIWVIEAEEITYEWSPKLVTNQPS